LERKSWGAMAVRNAWYIHHSSDSRKKEKVKIENVKKKGRGRAHDVCRFRTHAPLAERILKKSWGSRGRRNKKKVMKALFVKIAVARKLSEGKKGFGKGLFQGDMGRCQAILPLLQPDGQKRSPEKEKSPVSEGRKGKMVRATR